MGKRGNLFRHLQEPDIPDMSDYPDETGPYPKYVYMVRLVHDKFQVFSNVYDTQKKAEEFIHKIFEEGYSHDLEIIKTFWLFFGPCSSAQDICILKTATLQPQCL
jgi:hypothetical protein